MFEYSNGQGSFLDMLDKTTPGKPLVGLLYNTSEGDDGGAGFDAILKETKPRTRELLVIGQAPPMKGPILTSVTRGLPIISHSEEPAHPNISCEYSRGCKMD